MRLKQNQKHRAQNNSFASIRTQRIGTYTSVLYGVLLLLLHVAAGKQLSTSFGWWKRRVAFVVVVGMRACCGHADMSA